MLLATPPGFRPIHYAAAIAAGKHVFMEKPCCVDAPGFRTVMETNKLADEKGLKVVVGLQRRHSKEYRRQIKAIQDGSLGDLIADAGLLERRSDLDSQTRDPATRRWSTRCATGIISCGSRGDHIVEQHVHNIDVCNWAKNDHPVKANGMGSCHVPQQSRASARFTTITSSSLPTTTARSSTASAASSRACGTMSRSSSTARRAMPTCSWPATAATATRQEHVDLVNAIRNNEKLNDGWHGATSSLTAVLGRMATYSGQEVKWDEAVAKGPNEMPAKFAFDADPPAMPDKDGNYPMPIPGRYKPY